MLLMHRIIIRDYQIISKTFESRPPWGFAALWASFLTQGALQWLTVTLWCIVTLWYVRAAQLIPWRWESSYQSVTRASTDLCSTRCDTRRHASHSRWKWAGAV